ncbi:hypothetical protein GA0116948_10632 [Chitinophaga costaii]|uniref:Uncharacterized protein n=1 Tax=Chitinophaga costaii TaxID=1335309 RepID=A0A1C4DPH3_9BACT|nr:hypothetical protein GA0116948_10632 [Chitinophaga costaii]
MSNELQDFCRNRITNRDTASRRAVRKISNSTGKVIHTLQLSQLIKN